MNQPMSWRLNREIAGSGTHGDLNAHLIDLAHYLIGPIEEVVMTRLEGGAYKDAVRFANGKEVLLQRLDCGLTAVLVAASSDLIDIEDIAPPTAVREPELV